MQLYPRHILVIAELALILLFAGMLFNVAPDTVHAATTATTTKKPAAAPAVHMYNAFEVSGWIPYWRTATGTADVLPHISQLTEINPFGYTVKQDGELYDAAGIDQGNWDTLIAAAKAQHVRLIPTVMWSDTDAIHTVLSNKTLRAQHVQAIVDMVNSHNFDGVDIDYEGKKAEDINNFSAFLKQLYAKMGKKWVMCTIEARTPVDSRYLGTPPPDATQYANDLTQINKYCDRVRLMTYDQESADLKLSQKYASSTALYTPIADPAWVTKVVNLMSKSIKRSKIELGVATYGYIYQVTPQPDGTYDYSLLEAFNPAYGTTLAAQLGITPMRNAAGELSFTYVPDTLSKVGLPTQQQLADAAPAGTPSSLLAAAGAVQLAKAQSKTAPFYLLWWSDSKAIADKVTLAKKLGVRGVAVFKMDGGEDQAMWQYLVKK